MSRVQLEAILRLVDVQINPQVFRRISQAVAGMVPPLVQVQNHLTTINNRTNRVNSSLARTGNQLSINERAARLFLQRMAQFAILLPTFATLNKAIQGGVKFLFDFDSSLRDIVRIDVGNLAHRMEEIGDAALKTAVDFGVSAIEVLNTTRVFKQAGDSIEDSQERARVAILATQISTLNAAQATEVLIATSRQFGQVGKNSILVLDKLAKVEDIAAVNAADVAEAFRTGGNSLAQFSKSIDDSIGLIAALREQTRKSGREVGTFFKTLQTRLFAAGDARNAVEALGVTVQNLDGSLRPTLPVLNDLKKAFDGLTESQVANAAKAIGGVRQFESLIATLNSLEAANRFSQESSQAAGTADEKRAITDAKLERQLGKLIAQGQAFAASLGEAGLNDTLNTTLKLVGSLLKSFQSMASVLEGIGGSVIPLLALGGVTLGKGVFGLAGGRGGGGGGGSAATPGSGGTASKGPFDSVKGTLLFSLVGATLPAAFSLLSEELRKANAGFFDLTASVLDSSSNSLSMAAQFAVLGGKASAVAAAFGALQTAVPTIISALGDEFKARKEMKEQILAQDKEATVIGKLGSRGESGTKSANLLLDSLVKAMDDAGERSGKVFSGKMTEAFGVIGNQFKMSGPEFAKTFLSPLTRETAGIDGVNALGIDTLKNLKNGIQELSDVTGIEVFIGSQKDLLMARAEEIGTVEKLQSLLANVKGGNQNAAVTFGQLLDVIGRGAIEIDEVTGLMSSLTSSFAEFQKVLELQALTDSLRTLNLELELAQAGPDALADSVAKLENQLLLSQREFANTAKRSEDEIAGLISRLDEWQIGLNNAGVTAVEFFQKVTRGTKGLDTKGVQEFDAWLAKLIPEHVAAAKEITAIETKRVQDKIATTNLENALESEINRRRKQMMEAQAQAAQNAFESTRRFTAELRSFGQAVDTNVLSAFQNISLSDVDDVLAGTSNLDAAIQELISNSFASPLAQAQLELSNATENTQAELDILGSRLENVQAKLSDQANAADFAALKTEAHAIELSMEEAAQQHIVETTKLKVKVLDEERKANEEAAEAAKKHAELLEKLSDASHSFNQELRQIERAFEEFQQNKLSDLIGQEAEAQETLKEAQQEVLSTTQDLATAYDSLIKAFLEFNGAIAEAQIKSAMLSRDIGMLTGEIVTFDQSFASLGNAFRNVLNDANITLQKRIDLERQLADETLAFLTRAKDEIVQAGIGIFGQTGGENRELGQGIAGLQFVADQLGGSFENFLNLTQGELGNVTQTLLGLPTEFRQQILGALSFLPSSTDIGGFSVEQLTQAIGQIGAGVAPEAGLVSIEELTTQQVEQLQKLQDLALHDAQLQFAQVMEAQKQVQAAEEAVEVAKIMQERATENLEAVRDAVLEEKAILDMANNERRELLAAVIAADDKNTLMQIEKEAQLFADQNATFREVGDIIVQGISSAIGARLAVLEAAAAIGGNHKGYIPNFARGNLSPGEAAGLLRAASREKKAMPSGAGLAVANTSEAIIPMHRGHIPNYVGGSNIAAGISAVKGVNEAVVAAIAKSVTIALSNITADGSNSQQLLSEIVAQLNQLNTAIDEINVNSANIATNTVDSPAAGTSSPATQRVEISLQTNQNNTVSITGLDSLRGELEEAIANTTSEQVDTQVSALLQQLDEIFVALQERGILTSFGQTR